MARLLVVDDDPGFREWLTLVLRRAHHKVFATATGEEALEIAGRELPHLAFIDIMLPGISGFDTLAALRQDKATADLPVILISSLGQRQFFRQGMELGADDFIAKPVSAGDVVKALDARLKRSGHVEPGEGDAGMPERVGDFELGRRLAEGDLVNTYLARHASSRREATVRLTRATALDQAAIARFMREMDVAHALAHPHVAALLGYGVAQSRAYTVFEHFPQGTTAAMLRVPVAPALACRLVGQLASGLQALHDLDIVPGDLEPASIMPRAPGHALIGQYGMRSVAAGDGPLAGQESGPALRQRRRNRHPAQRLRALKRLPEGALHGSRTVARHSRWPDARYLRSNGVSAASGANRLTHAGWPVRASTPCANSVT